MGQLPMKPMRRPTAGYQQVGGKVGQVRVPQECDLLIGEQVRTPDTLGVEGGDAARTVHLSPTQVVQGGVNPWQVQCEETAAVRRCDGQWFVCDGRGRFRVAMLCQAHGVSAGTFGDQVGWMARPNKKKTTTLDSQS